MNLLSTPSSPPWRYMVLYTVEALSVRPMLSECGLLFQVNAGQSVSNQGRAPLCFASSNSNKSSPLSPSHDLPITCKPTFPISLAEQRVASPLVPVMMLPQTIFRSAATVV